MKALIIGQIISTERLNDWISWYLKAIVISKKNISMQKPYTKFFSKIWNTKTYKKNVEASDYKHQGFTILVERIQKCAIYKRSKLPSSLLSL